MPTKNDRGRVERWVDGAPGGPDGHLGEIFRALPPAEGLSAEKLASVGWRLARNNRPKSRWLRVRELSLVLAVLAGGGGAALAERARPGWWHLLGVSLFTPRVDPVSSDLRGGAASRVTPVAVPRGADSGARGSHDFPAMDVAPPSAPVEPQERGLAGDPPVKPNAQPAYSDAPLEGAQRGSAVRPSAIALESQALQQALAKLRRDHDPRSALALLDDYQARFPHGELAVEAAVARLDALLLMGKRSDALALLAKLPLDRAGRKSELQLLRAELYAERDCSQALADFDAVLTEPLAPALGERALYGRATCRLKSGDAPGAKADLERYLGRYPNGRFATQARAYVAAP